MNNFSDLSVSDWAMLGLVCISYLFITVKAGEWLFGLIIRKCHRFIIRKDRKQVAINELFDAFDFDEKATTTAKTGGSWVISVWKEKP